jgi:hypothetical protein
VVAGLVTPDLYIARPSDDLLEARQAAKKVAVMPEPAAARVKAHR